MMLKTLYVTAAIIGGFSAARRTDKRSGLFQISQVGRWQQVEAYCANRLAPLR